MNLLFSMCLHLLERIEEEESYIILRLLDCLKILLSKNDIKVVEEDYIGKVILLLSHKDIDVKIKAIEALTLRSVFKNQTRVIVCDIVETCQHLLDI